MSAIFTLPPPLKKNIEVDSTSKYEVSHLPFHFTTTKATKESLYVYTSIHICNKRTLITSCDNSRIASNHKFKLIININGFFFFL